MLGIFKMLTDLDGFTEISEGMREPLMASWLNQLLYGQNHYFVILSSSMGSYCVS